MKTNIKIPGLEIINKLGEGAQGEVFHVQRSGQDLALKLYNEQSATSDQHTIIRHLIEVGMPRDAGPDRFVWPKTLVELPNSKRFGYLMPLIDMGRYITLADIEAGRIPHPGFGVMAESGRQLAEGFRILHIDGLCCRDISANNFLFSSKTGDVVICDNDNIVVDKQDLGSILGTPQFMAPEVILGNTKPSTVTDQYSLAVLLFMLLCGGHPLHGLREYNIRIYDGVAAQELYGRNPIFVFDPSNASNRLPDNPGYRHVAKHWKVLPTEIKRLFTKAFTEGLSNPAARVTDLEWKNALTRMLAQRHICTCGAENFWDPFREDQRSCWHKGCSVPFPAKLYIKGKSVGALLAKPGQMLTSLHFGEKSTVTIVGEMEKHPSDASLIVLRNKTNETWDASMGQQKVEIPAGRAVPLHPGLIIKAANHEIMVYP